MKVSVLWLCCGDGCGVVVVLSCCGNGEGVVVVEVAITVVVLELKVILAETNQ